MAISYAKWSLADLHKEQARIEKAIASKEGRQKKNVLAKVTTLARKHGFSLDELTEGKAASTAGAPVRRSPSKKKKASSLKGAKVPAKYRSQTDKTLTWTGRGRTPLWVQEHESGGGKREDLLIKKK